MCTSEQGHFGPTDISVVRLVVTGVFFGAAALAAADQPTALDRMRESLARQKASVDLQMSSIRQNFGMFRWSSAATATPAAECEPMSAIELDPVIAAAATAHQVKPEVLRAVIRKESAFRPCAVSPKGAMGLMQIMPDTATQLGLADPFRPANNVKAGAQYLKQLLDQYKGDLRLALAAYNAGPARLTGNPPVVPDIPETRNYVEQILKELAARP
jgi:soluble lytic murein transglycosylase-like protein